MGVTSGNTNQAAEQGVILAASWSSLRGANESSRTEPCVVAETGHSY